MKFYLNYQILTNNSLYDLSALLKEKQNKANREE